MRWPRLLCALAAVAAATTVSASTAGSRERTVTRLSAAPRLVGFSVAERTFPVAAHGQASRRMPCPASKVPIGGGVWTHDSVNRFVNSSYPQGRGWAVVVNNNDASPADFTVFA